MISNAHIMHSLLLISVPFSLVSNKNMKTTRSNPSGVALGSPTPLAIDFSNMMHLSAYEPQLLRFKLQGRGYDPRGPKPVIYGSNFSGGCPPITQLVILPGQVVTVSTDILDFEVIPQHSSVHRLLVLRNIIPLAGKGKFYE